MYWPEGRYWRNGRLIEDRECVRLVMRLENRFARLVGSPGSSISICCISLCNASAEALLEDSPEDGRKSRLDLADSTVGAS